MTDRAAPAVFFDLDRTLLRTPSMVRWLRHGPWPERQSTRFSALPPARAVVRWLCASRRPTRADPVLAAVCVRLRGAHIDDVERCADSAAVRITATCAELAMLEAALALQEEGHRVVVLSAGLDPLVQALARHLGLNEARGSLPELDADGLLTGRIRCYLSGEAKLDAARRLAGDSPFSACGNGIADLRLLSASSSAIATRPGPGLWIATGGPHWRRVSRSALRGPTSRVTGHVVRHLRLLPSGVGGA